VSNPREDQIVVIVTHDGDTHAAVGIPDRLRRGSECAGGVVRYPPSRNAVVIYDIYVEPFDLLTPGRRPSAVLRRYAAACGHEGREGGWIYRIADDKPLEQGWWSYAARVLRHLGHAEMRELPAGIQAARAELRTYGLRRALERQAR
jgi:hypothetical protein